MNKILGLVILELSVPKGMFPRGIRVQVLLLYWELRLLPDSLGHLNQTTKLQGEKWAIGWLFFSEY